MNDVDSSINNGLLDTEAAIRPFLDILRDDRSLNVSTLRSLIVKVLVHPEIYCGFDQFKAICSSSPQFQGDGKAGAAIFNTLDLFSYGSLKDHALKQQQNTPEYYLPLNETALAKLGQLTILSCIQDFCFHGATRISYVSLAESLGWATASQLAQDDSWIRNVEDLLIRCLYAKVLKGKLCQKTWSFGWENESLPIVCSRDVPPQQIPRLLAALKGLGKRLEISEKEISQAQNQVTKGLNQATNFVKSVKEHQKMAQSESFKTAHHSSRKPQQAFPLAVGPQWLDSGADGAGGSPNSRNTGRSAASRSSKRSRGGGSFATESAFRM
jgi:hypothetical protein